MDPQTKVEVLMTQLLKNYFFQIFKAFIGFRIFFTVVQHLVFNVQMNPEMVFHVLYLNSIYPSMFSTSTLNLGFSYKIPTLENYERQSKSMYLVVFWGSV